MSGVRIRWRRLGVTILGASLLATFEGLVAWILSLADIPIRLFGGLGDFVGRLVELLILFPSTQLWRAWLDTLPLIRDAGILGFVVAIALVLATLYIVAEVISRVR